jgi:dTDP-4-amino-4,6-dideoxygalactose transaminase
LRIGVRGLGLEPGAEVILPSFTFSAVLNVVLQEELARIVEIVRPPLAESDGLAGLSVRSGLGAEFIANDRDWISQSLTQKGIATGRYFAPLHQQRVLQARPFEKNAKERGTRKKTRGTETANLKGWAGKCKHPRPNSRPAWRRRSLSRTA